MYYLDLIATLIFSMVGATVAPEAKIQSAIITALGGGTIRDIALRKKIFWLENPIYFLVVILGILIVLKMKGKV